MTSFFLTVGRVLCPLPVSFSLSTRMRPSCADKTEPRRLFPDCAWCLLPPLEAKTRLLCPKTSLSLRVGGCFPPLWHGPTHLPSREVFPGCFSFLSRVSFWLVRLRSDPAAWVLDRLLSKTALFIAPWCRLDAASSVPQANVHSRADAPWLRQACPKKMQGRTWTAGSWPSLTPAPGRAGGHKTSTVLGARLLISPGSLLGAGFGLQPPGFAPSVVSSWKYRAVLLPGRAGLSQWRAGDASVA